MRDYISRADAEKLLRKKINLRTFMRRGVQNAMKSLGYICEELDNIPAADVRPVALCRDCKHYNPSNRDWKCESVMGLVEPDEEDFCSYGERKGADHELLKL